MTSFAADTGECNLSNLDILEVALLFWLVYKLNSIHIVFLEEWTRSVRSVNKAKMTFRFDDQGRQASQEHSNSQDRQVLEERDFKQDLSERSLDKGTQPSSFPEGNEERIDRDPNSYRAVEMVDDWGDPFTDYTGTHGIVVPAYMNHGPRRTSWWKVAGSLTGAIVTGALFGFVVLSMFNGGVTVPIPGISVPNQTAAGEAVADLPVFVPIGEADTVGSASGITVNIALPEQTYHFLQYGVFSTAEGVQLAQKELQDSGIAAARDTIDEKRVYAGVSPDREQAKLLSSQLKTAGVNLILHEITFPSSAEVVYNGDVTSLERYFAQSAELISLLSSLSASRLVEVSPQALTAEEMAELKQSHQLWTESAAAVRGQQPETFAAESGEMEKAMNSAVEAMGEYNKKGAKTLLWEVQDEMMSFILSEQKVVNSGS